MVTVFLKGFDPEVKKFEFFALLPTVDACLDLLNKIVSLEHTLTTAYIVEDEYRTHLPVAAFDGLPVAHCLQALETKWQEILSKPRPFDVAQKEELIYLTKRRINLHNASIQGHQKMIDRFTEWIERTQVWSPLSPNGVQLVQHYESQIAIHQAYLGKAHCVADLVAKRLSQLTA